MAATVGELIDEYGGRGPLLAELRARGRSLKDIHSLGGRQKPVPSSWRRALELDDPAASPGSAAGAAAPGFDDAAGGLGDVGAGERQTETPPVAPAGAKVQPSALQVRGFARDRIAKTYRFVGTGLAMGADPEGANSDSGPGGGIVAAWDNFAPPIADAWIAAAEEGNVLARRFVELMSAGGTMGEVVTLHVGLIGTTLYVMGQIPEVGPLFGRYRKYRREPAAAVDSDGPATSAAGRARANGAADPGATGRVASPTRTA